MKLKVAFFATGISALLLTLYFNGNDSGKSGDYLSRPSHTFSTGVEQNTFTDPLEHSETPYPELSQVTSQLAHEGEVINGNTADNAKQLQSFDDLITVEDGKAFMDTSLIDAMTSQQVANHISHLPNTMTQLRSVGIHERMLADTRRFETDNDDIYVHDFQCSDLLCGLIFETTNAESAHSALSSISSLSSFRNESKGGSLRLIEEGGVYYGVIVASISESSLTLR